MAIVDGNLFIFLMCIYVHLLVIAIYSSRELTAEHKLLAVLRIFACGNFEQTAADYIGISQPSMANILPKVRISYFVRCAMQFSFIFGFIHFIFVRCAMQFCCISTT